MKYSGQCIKFSRN